MTPPPPFPVSTRRLRVGWLIAGACLVPAVLDGWQSYLQEVLGGSSEIPWRGMAFQAGEWVILGALTPLVYALAARFPLRGERVARNVLVHVAGALVLCVGWALLGVALRAVLGTLPSRMPLPAFVASWLLTSLPWSVFMYFTVLGCVFAFAYFGEAREREALAARLSAQVAEARLDALRMQLHPHFLFNSLNAVAVLVRDSRNEDAARVVEQLSEILREVLGRGDDAREIPVSREIAFLEKYLAIEQVRYSDRLVVAWGVDPAALPALVPAFVLQPLVENALRHGVAASSAPCRIDITAAVEGGDLVLAVTNDVPAGAAPGVTRGSGVGIANTRERLATMFGGSASVALGEGGGRVRAVVRLPWHETPAAPAEGGTGA
jgi:two-component system, LytTR family, sensor kinase